MFTYLYKLHIRYPASCIRYPVSRIWYLRKYAVILLLPVLLAACFNSGEKEKRFAGYNMDAPEKFTMPGSLLEISGIAFYKGLPDTIYAIQDEEGKLFRLPWKVSRQMNAKFGKKGDYEDLAILKEKVIVLKSNGTLYSFPFRDAIYEDVDSVQEWKDIIPKGEYEGMFGDPATGDLYVLCKKCEEDDPSEKVTGYVLSLGDSIALKSTFSIDVEQIKAFTGKVKRGFRPSGLARNPLTGDWFIVSAVNKLLISADSNWKIKETCPLNVNLFNQPEGIAFDNQGNLYISNEGDDISDGKILRFTQHHKKP